MAFPIPSHLPRKGIPQDISSQILSKVASASTKTLNAELSASWLSELEDTILQTKTRIHDRIHSDLPAFERQLASSKSVKERLQTLAANVDALDAEVTDAESGLIPSLLNALSSHASLAQQALDAEVVAESLEHLFRCRTLFDSLRELVDEGKLPEAVQACKPLEIALGTAPLVLAQAEVLQALKHNFRAMKDRLEEQLSDAYNRSIVISPHGIAIHPAVQVRNSLNVVTLQSILSSLSPASLSNHLTTLRRDLAAHYIEYLVTQPAFLTVNFSKDASGTPQQTLALNPTSPNTEDRMTRLENLAQMLDFVAENLFPALPASHAASFKQSLCKPLTTALLHSFLIPLLPSSLAALPPFIALVEQATDVEERYIVGLLGQDARDREVLHWAEGVASHYERKRRAEILERVREIVLNEEEGERVRVEVEVEVAQAQWGPMAEAAPEPTAGDGQKDSWGFGDEDETAKESTMTVDDDGWGFDDDSVELEQNMSADVAQQPAPESKPTVEPVESTEDTSDAWGWNDDDDNSPSAAEGTNGGASEPASTSSSMSVDEDSSAWDDDPWADPEVDTEPPIPALKSPPGNAPKPATRLERLAQKSKGKSMHTPQASIDSQVAVPPPPSTPVKSVAKRPQKITVQVKSDSKATEQPPEKEKEVYAVSARAREVAEAVDAALREGREFAASPLFESVASSSSQQRGSVIIQSAPAIVDLYCALFPVRFGKALEKSTERTMVFANDCMYLSGYATRSAKGIEEQEKLAEVAAHLKVWGESWFQDAVNQQREANAAVLADAEGFEGTADQERFDECEAAVTRVVGQIRSTSRQWKNVLRKSQYFPALGDVVDSVLAQMLETILALPDITEVESHRLSELCRILNSLEGLFLDTPDQPSSVVAYVPSWLKFSYLSELLEASLADISYLFEEGTLVDFEVHELVKLVEALFADTPQRGNIINKLMAGHPQPS